MAYRDKDYILSEDVIFKVKRYTHPPGYVQAFPRFIPFDKVPLEFWGMTWRIRGREYSRFDVRVTNNEEITAVYEAFERLYPDFVVQDPYLGEITAVPEELVREHFTPLSSLARLRKLQTHDDLQKAALRLAQLCTDAGVPSDAIGITDSLMFDAHTVGFSDVDLVIYGADNYKQVRDYLTNIDDHHNVRFPSIHEWADTYRQTKVKDMPLDPYTYAKHKVRKYEQGTIDGHKFSIFGVRADDEIVCDYGIPRKSIGPLEVRGEVVDSSESMFRPSIYRVAIDKTWASGQRLSTRIVTVINYRREYISQAHDNECVSVYGWGELHGNDVTIILGELAMRGQDYIVVDSLA